MSDASSTTGAGEPSSSGAPTAGGTAQRVGEGVGFAGPARRWIAVGFGLLGLALAVNTVIGPLVTDLVTYPFSQTMEYQTIGLEAVTLAIVAPWCLVAAVLVWRNHRAAAAVAIPPAAYAAYMFVQYVIGPLYLEYQPVLLFHLGVFVASATLLVVAWHRLSRATLPGPSRSRRRLIALGLLLQAGFVLFRYLPSFEGMLTGGPVSAEIVADPAMFWAIFWLDLGVVVPLTVGVAIGLLVGARWAKKAVYGLVGWYVLVPISVAAMGTVMLLNDDPHAAIGQVIVLSIAALVFTLFAAWVYRPLVRPNDTRATAP